MINRVIFKNMVVVWILLIVEFIPVTIVSFCNFLKKILSSSILFSFSFLLWAQLCNYSNVKTSSNQTFFPFIFLPPQFPTLSVLVKSEVLNYMNYHNSGFGFYLENHLRHCKSPWHQADLIQHWGGRLSPTEP